MTIEATRSTSPPGRAPVASDRGSGVRGGGASIAPPPRPVQVEGGAPARGAYDPFLAVATLLAIWVTVLPLLNVLAPGLWLVLCAFVTIAVLGTGLLLRKLRRRALVVTAVTAAVLVATLTALFAGEEALFGFIPTPGAIAAIPAKVDAAMLLIVEGSAPLNVTPELAFLLVAGIGVLTLVLDIVVNGMRLAALAIAPLAAVFVIPALAVPRELEASGLVLFAVCIALLLRAEVRGRERIVDALPRRSSGVAASAAAIAAVAIIGTMVIAPVIPDAQRTTPGPLSIFSDRINPTLTLGNDLRSPVDMQVLEVRTNAPSAPYLRVVTLSTFDGEVWQPDREEGELLTDTSQLLAPEVNADVRVVEYATTINVVNLISPWLPLPYPTVEIEGLNGEWLAIDNNQTVFSRSTTSADQRYTATSLVPRPTVEQARVEAVSGRANAGRDQVYTALPANTPEIIGDTANEVTAGASNDYDRLIALQRWFRSTEFRYSLEAPVEDGFDGAGVDAVAAFLEVRSGYCIHFASAFALMARSLGMPTRIVVGYLPGSATPERFDGQSVYTVGSSQLHAWPEVLFPGFGWVPFEPTNSLGSPTGFSPASASGNGGTGSDPSNPSDAGPNAEPTPTPSLAVNDPSRGGGPTTVRAVDPTPLLLTIAFLLIALSLPALVRELRRRQRLTATRAGDAVAAWREVLDIAVDLGIRLSPGESPRELAQRLVRDHGAPEEHIGYLVSAIEDASYAPRANSWHFADGPALADAVLRVRSDMLRAVGAGARILSIFAPRSLVVRATSAFASAEDSAARAFR